MSHLQDILTSFTTQKLNEDLCIPFSARALPTCLVHLCPLRCLCLQHRWINQRLRDLMFHSNAITSFQTDVPTGKVHINNQGGEEDAETRVRRLIKGKQLHRFTPPPSRREETLYLVTSGELKLRFCLDEHQNRAGMPHFSMSSCSLAWIICPNHKQTWSRVYEMAAVTQSCILTYITSHVSSACMFKLQTHGEHVILARKLACQTSGWSGRGEVDPKLTSWLMTY